MSIGECMEYAQKLCDATTSEGRNEARAELRAAIAGAVAAERERWISACNEVRTQHAETGREMLRAAHFSEAIANLRLKMQQAPAAEALKA